MLLFLPASMAVSYQMSFHVLSQQSHGKTFQGRSHYIENNTMHRLSVKCWGFLSDSGFPVKILPEH